MCTTLVALKISTAPKPAVAALAGCRPHPGPLLQEREIKKHKRGCLERGSLFLF